MRRSVVATALVFAVLVAIGVMPSLASSTPAAHRGPATFVAHGSVEQVYVTGLAPDAAMTLLDPLGNSVATQQADAQGGLLFRNLAPGDGYRVKLVSSGDESGPLSVLSTQSAPPSTAVYNQTIPSSGYGYLTTRDGTQLSYSVHPPSDVLKQLPGVGDVIKKLNIPIPFGGPPYPTLIEYGGYGFADPAGPQNGIATVANLMGFAVVDVNMRGTGCSGGAFDFFEPLQNLDGYDVIETVARQPWVLNHQVGMLGISYGGISQLFTAQTQPPHLAAIAPLSVIDATQTTLYPGGLLNTGFAVDWAKERVHDALPASPTGGQSWAWKQIQGGDTTCAANQALHGEAVDLLAKVRANSHYVPAVADPLDPRTFVNKINVPVFMACQATDEQTGGHCADLVSHFTGTAKKWFTFTNGQHIDSLDPETFNRWFDFLEIYVAHRSPLVDSVLTRAAAPLVYQQAMGLNGMTLPQDAIQSSLTLQAAQTSFEALPEVRVLFDNGAGGASATAAGALASGDVERSLLAKAFGAPTDMTGFPYPTFEHSFSTFPVPGTQAQRWFLGGSGALGDQPASTSGADRFTWNASTLPLTDFTGDSGGGTGGLWTALPNYQWKQNPTGTAVSYVTAPLTAPTTTLGFGSVNLWVRSSTPTADLQATISEVRPDGKETFVQDGWVRANERALDPTSTDVRPVLSLKAADVAAMPAGQYVPVTVPLYFEAHAFRPGSRIRVTIAAPNGTLPIWSFGETQPAGTAIIDIAHSAQMPSSVVLPVVPGLTIPTPLPPCPSLRGEPCRTYVALTNQPADVAAAKATPAAQPARHGNLAFTGLALPLGEVAGGLLLAALGLLALRRRRV